MLQRLGPGTGVCTVAVDERTVHVEKHRVVVERHAMRYKHLLCQSPPYGGVRNRCLP